MLLLSGTQGDISKAEDVRLNNYEEVPVKVQKFTPNELVLEVDNPLSASAWLYVARIGIHNGKPKSTESRQK